MKSTTKRSYVIFALIVFFFVGLGLMIYSFVSHGDEWVSSKYNGHVYRNGILSVAGTIYDRNGTELVKTEDGRRVYNSDWSTRVSTLHVVGDREGFIATGAQTAFRPQLIGYDFANGMYKAVSSKDGIALKLTIDAKVSAAAYNALYGRKGAICVYNYKTGEVICEVSAPSYDPDNKPDVDADSDKYEAVYLNRCVSGVFTPGSTFKVVTALCALENIENVQKMTFTCTGKYHAGDGDVICNNHSGHGKLTFERALNVSCNSVFAELAVKLGRDKLQATAKKLGFGKSFSVSGIATTASRIDLTKASKLELGWAGIGQHTTLANPLHMMLIAGTIANSGEYVAPYIVENDSVLPKEITDLKKTTQSITIDENNARTLKKLLRSNVENYYGDSKFPGLQMCGKTGSAEVEGERSHAWFYGFSARKDLPYAIAVCIQNGGTGYSDAVPLANTVMQAVAESVK